MSVEQRSWLKRLRERIISEDDSEHERLKKTLAIFACGLMACGSMLWLAIYQAMGMKFSATVPLTYVTVSAVSFGIYVWNRDFAAFRTVQASLFLFVPFMMQWSIGSYVSSSGVMLWALLAPVGIMIFQGARNSLPWFFAYLVMTAVSGVFDFYLGTGTQSGVTMQSIAVFFTLNFVAISVIVFLLISYFVGQRDILETALAKQNSLLHWEQERSERLLLNILPGPIAERLKDKQTIIADGFADVTVMFADIVDFTHLSGKMSPRFLVAMLNQLFSHFDELAEKYSVEKIKTIGDAYMVAAGLDSHYRAVKKDEPELDYSDSVVSMAIEMRDYVAGLTSERVQGLQIHVGISSGPVVAGVIGTKKFIYDLWGDTVNLASRVTDVAGPGVILVDVATHMRLRNLYDFEGPLTYNLKGKGDVKAYVVLQRKTGLPPAMPVHVIA
ncbi:MAG: adenylate/guanylate cyclase domain-containing protein [Burkholderiales bacterium]|nr:adenylate/guanylate cyclase domain-containing protein [Burkholderiales bacterium]